MDKNPEDDLEEERRKKQAFLCKEIVEVGYDPFVFQNYLDSLKKEGFFTINGYIFKRFVKVVLMSINGKWMN